MACQKRHQVLYNSAAAATGDWNRLDNRYEFPEDRTVQAFVTAGDTVYIEVASKDVKGQMGAAEAAMLLALLPEDITVLTSFTASGTYVIDGPWSYVRVRKTGTAGLGKVQGFI
jgi:hypothetical protein